jgi:pimeloyl-ACP methyl ester carboxylesterase
MVEDDIDSRIRAVETDLLAHYGVTATERMIEVGPAGERMRVVEIGADSAGIPVVLLHGVSSVSAVSYPLLPHLADRRVVAVDWLGHGLSDPFVLDKRADLPEHIVAVVDGVLDALDLDVVDLLGHSMGAQFSLGYALARPERIRRIVTLGAPGAAFVELAPPLVFKALSTPVLGRALLSMPMSRSQYRRTNDLVLGPTAVDGHPAELVEVGYLTARRPGVARSVASFVGRFITPFSIRPGVTITHARLATIAAPVLVVWGDHDTVLTPVAAAGSIAAMPESTLFTVRGGHAPWLDEPDAVGARIAQFLTVAA